MEIGREAKTRTQIEVAKSHEGLRRIRDSIRSKVRRQNANENDCDIATESF